MMADLRDLLMKKADMPELGSHERHQGNTTSCRRPHKNSVRHERPFSSSVVAPCYGGMSVYYYWSPGPFSWLMAHLDISLPQCEGSAPSRERVSYQKTGAL